LGPRASFNWVGIRIENHASFKNWFNPRMHGRQYSLDRLQIGHSTRQLQRKLQQRTLNLSFSRQ
jgi:hypothetical protein